MMFLFGVTGQVILIIDVYLGVDRPLPLNEAVINVYLEESCPYRVKFNIVNGMPVHFLRNVGDINWFLI